MPDFGLSCKTENFKLGAKRSLAWQGSLDSIVNDVTTSFYRVFEKREASWGHCRFERTRSIENLQDLELAINIVQAGAIITKH